LGLAFARASARQSSTLNTHCHHINRGGCLRIRTPRLARIFGLIAWARRA
jgi:hypothetical protein